MNDTDAAACGITDGDTVLIENPYGKILRQVSASPLVMPGVVIIGQGAWTRMNQEGIDIGGNTNVLSPGRLCGEGQSPWNTVTVRIEKWTKEELAPDYLWDKQED